ncbi:MAG TPA: DUF3592 domain-containing protein [Planctomycetota bacterium]|nr:DUF3592 domain-containing protein [Planctomycetota bacterium]
MRALRSSCREQSRRVPGWHVPRQRCRARHRGGPAVLGRGRDAWAVGRPVPVRYLTARPETAELDGPLALWGATAAFAALAIAFLAVGLGLCLGLIPG